MRFCLILAGGLVALNVSASNAADISGTWVMSGEFAAPTCKISQFKGFLRGTCEGPEAKGIAFGVIDQQTTRWTYQWSLKSDGSIGAFVFEGKLRPDGSMAGTGMSTTGNTGTFVSKRQAP